MAKLKIGGTWAGVIEVVLEEWTEPMLRIEVAKRSNCGPSPVGAASRRESPWRRVCWPMRNALGDSAESSLASLYACFPSFRFAFCCFYLRRNKSRAAATALAKRHADGSLPVEDFNIEVEDQSGQIVQLGSETDQRAVMMGLMLHANGKQLIRSENYNDALEVLTMGEEAFSLCNPKVIELIDNVPILQIDMVWCYFMLRDIRWLSVAGARLEKAREGIERAHGKDYSRVRLLQAGCHPELAIDLRLELLEGVVAYHNGDFDRSRKALTSAHAKYFQLQVPDEALSLVMSMGFKERDAKRALRMSNQDVGNAVDFLVEEKAKRAQKREEDIRRRTEIMEQKRYGMTPSKKAVDLNKLNELVSVGFEKELAAEALRRNENDFEKALDNLTNPEANSAIQVDIESRKRKRKQQASETAIEQLVRMGFERSRVVAALQAGATIEQAMHQLLSQSDSNPTVGADNSANSCAPILPDASGSSNDVGGPSTASEAEERDAEMEDALAGELAKGDALTDYDIEVTNEGEAINEYLALLESAGNSMEASRQ